MKIGITGLSNSGKTTVFNALTGLGVETTAYASTGGEPHLGVVKVPDPRVEALTAIFKPRKTTHSTVQFVDYIGLTRGDPKQNRAVFEFIKDSDALLHVVRAFMDDSVPHPLGGVDPMRDISALEDELLLGDLELVEQRLKGIEASRKKGKKPGEEEERALLLCREALEGGKALRDAGFGPEQAEALRHLQFMSLKPMIVVLNVGEEDIRGGLAQELEQKAADFYKGSPSVRALALGGRIEMEIAELPPDEARAFLDDLGVKESARDRLIRTSYDCLGLISFLTVGSDDVRAWAVRRGSSAFEAAGKVHTDIQRGFIRAEVVGYDDFMGVGGLAEARDKGLLRLEGKGYIIQDGDIVNFRFNV